MSAQIEAESYLKGSAWSPHLTSDAFTYQLSHGPTKNQKEQIPPIKRDKSNASYVVLLALRTKGGVVSPPR